MTRRRRRILISLGVVLGLLVGAGFILTWRLDAILNHYKDSELPKLSERLGRPVHVGRIATTLFSGLGVTVDDISIGADPGTPADQMALLTVARVRVRAAALPALFSLGRRIRVSELRVESPVVNLVRLPDGRLNVDRVTARLEETAPPSSAPDEPMSPGTRDLIESARLDAAVLIGGKVRLTDLQALGAPVEISALGLELRDVGLKSAWTAVLTAGVLSATKNLELRTRFGAAGDLDHVPPPLEAVRLQLARTDLAPLAPFLSRLVSGLQAATASADLDADLGALAPNGKGPTKMKGGVTLGGVRFAGGAAFDAGLDSDVAGDAARGDLEVRKLVVTVGRLGLDGHGRIEGLDKVPRFDNFAVETRGVDFDELRRLYPALDRAAGVSLHGPATAKLVASGTAAAQSFALEVDLSQASITKPKLLDKPRGTTLKLHAQGKLDGDALKLDQLGLQLADLDLHGGGSVRRFKTPIVDLRVDAQLGNLASLLRLLPSVAAELPAGANVAGSLAIHAQASGSAGDLKAHAELTLAGANLKLPSARLSGGGRVVADVNQKGSAAHVHVDADLGALEAYYEDLIHKPARMPMALTLDAERQGAKLTPKLDLKLATMHARAEGTIIGEVAPQADLTVTLEGLTMTALSALLPSLGAGMPPIAVTATAHVRGRSDKLETIRAEVRGLKLTSRKSDLTGDLTLKNLVRPEVELTARSSYLDTADILPKSEPAPPSGSATPARPKDEEPSLLAKARGHASVSIARGVASGVPFENMQAELQLADGRVRATKLEVGAWGGHFSGSGSEFDLVDDKGPFRVVGKVSQLDVEQLLARFGDSHGLLKGRLSADIDTRGRGTSAIDLQKTLEGMLGGSVAEAQLVASSLTGAIGTTLSKQLPLGNVGQKLSGTTNLRTLAGQVQFAAGAMHLSKPMTADTPEGPLALTGRVFLDGRLDLTGTLKMTPQAATALTGGKVKLSGPLPLSLKLGGDLRHPSVSLGNMADVVRLMAAALGAAGVQDKANDLLKKSGIAGKVPGLDAGKIPTSEADARAKAEEAARTAQAAAQKQAEQAVQQARAQAEAEAKRRAEEARKKLEDQAGERLKGIFGGH